MNASNLFGIDYTNRLVFVDLLLTVNLFILHTVLGVVLLIPSDPSFMSVIPRFLDIFMLQSANWNMMIALN